MGAPEVWARTPRLSRPPIPYTPVCSTNPLPVCVHPAYRAQLGETATLINRIAAPVVGLPGAPTRPEQRPALPGVVHVGARSVLAFAPIDVHDPTNPPQLVASWVGQLAVSLVADTTSLPTQFWTTDKAQNAAALYLLQQAGVQYNLRQFDESPDVLAAERRTPRVSPRSGRNSRSGSLHHGRTDETASPSRDRDGATQTRQKRRIIRCGA